LDSIDRLFEILTRRNLRAGLRAAAVTVALAIGIRIALPFYGFPFVTFIPAVLITAFIGGWLPATLASAASLLYAWRFLLPVAHPFPTVFNSAYAMVAVSFVFATEIACLEVIRVAARRAVARRQRADELLAERDTMFRELQHRVANNMQFISSLLAMQGRRLPPGDVAREILRDAADRLHRFALIHRRLHDSHLADRRFDTLVREILSDLLHATGCARISVDVAADPAALPLDTLTTLILITTEVATNAIKHVFAKSRGTRLSVSLARNAQGDFDLVIADDGPGFSEGAAPESGTSLGFRIMGALVQGLHGTMHTSNAEGAVVRVVFPAPGNVAPSAEVVVTRGSQTMQRRLQAAPTA
jgi:two-component sensor histidine kinase